MAERTSLNGRFQVDEEGFVARRTAVKGSLKIWDQCLYFFFSRFFHI